MSRLGDILTAEHAGEADGPGVHALVVWNCNPLVIVPNAELIRRGLERDDLFTVVHEQFLTDTARYADIVLPATTQIETDDVVLPWGHLWVGWNGAAIAPVGESISNTELFRRLAAAMGYTEPALFDDDDTLLAPGAADGRPRRTPLDRLGACPLSGRRPAVRRRRVRHAVRSGRVRLRGARADGSTPPADLRRHHARGRAATRNSLARFPLQLLTPKHHTRFLNSGYSHLPKHGPAGGWSVRRTRRRPMRRSGVSPTAIAPRSGTTGRRSRCPSRSPTGCARESSPSRSAGGAPRIPTARSPTA